MIFIGLDGLSFYLGRMYFAGRGVTRDYVKAVELYQKACEGKSAKGCCNLGGMYEMGNGVRQSVEDALRLLHPVALLPSQAF